MPALCFMQITSYAVRVDLKHDLQTRPEYFDFELFDAHKPDNLLLRSLYVTLQWVKAKDGDEIRKAC